MSSLCLRRSAARIAVVFAVLSLLGGSSIAYAQGAVQRPIQEFVDAQGTFCIDDGMGGCFLFVPPIENFLGQSDPSNGLLSSVDYAGLADEWIQGTFPNGCEMSFGTTFSGKVTEKPLQDGRAHVHVVLHTDNALTWVTEGDVNNLLLFGSRAPDVCDKGAEPSLGNITFIVDLINTAPGDPLPDLLQVLIDPALDENGNPLQEILILKTRARANGPLRPAFGVEDGTPGKFNTTQNGLLVSPSNAPWNIPEDGFPVERIKLKVVGN